jgi:branched-subunit amino acid transport protein AzlD
MNAYLYPKRSWRFRLRLWKPGLAGLLFGSVFPIAFALRQFLNPDSYTTRVDRIVQIFLGLAVLVVVGIVLIVFAGHRTTPIYRHPNRFAAGVVETATTGFLGLLGVTPLFLLLLILQLFDRQGSPLGSLFIPLAGLMVGFVRAGTILSFGILSSRRANKIVQVFGGAAIGSLAFMLVLVVGFIFFAWSDQTYAFNWLVAAWLVHLPIAFGAANAFASVDKEALPTFDLVLIDHWRGLRTVILIITFLLSLGLNISTWKWIAADLPHPGNSGGISP